MQNSSKFESCRAERAGEAVGNRSSTCFPGSPDVLASPTLPIFNAWLGKCVGLPTKRAWPLCFCISICTDLGYQCEISKNILGALCWRRGSVIEKVRGGGLNLHVSHESKTIHRRALTIAVVRCPLPVALRCPNHSTALFFLLWW